MTVNINITLKNMEGIFVGDLRKVLSDRDWEQIYIDDYRDGNFYWSKKAGQFASCWTEKGNEIFKDKNSKDEYKVENGLIGVADLRAVQIIPDTNLDKFGVIISDADKVQFKNANGIYYITVYKDNNIIKEIEIDTNW